LNIPDESVTKVTLNQKTLTLLGTAHVSRASVEQVEWLLSENEYDAVAVELCANRHHAMIDPDRIAKMDLFQVLRDGKSTVVIANLALGAYQQRIADEVGVEPGAEMRMAVRLADEQNIPLLLIDREISTTLKRAYRNVPWWQRMTLISGLLASVISNEKVTEEEIESLKEGDLLESALSQFAEQNKQLFEPLIEERDKFMVATLQSKLNDTDYKNILVVVGAGHVKGMAQQLAKNQPGIEQVEQTIYSLNQIPKRSRWPKLIPWFIVALILIGFGIGFARNTDLGFNMILDWVFINGGLSALGATLATAHPITILVAFIAAPLTSLNPMIGAGIVTAGVELFLRKPEVGDFSKLRSDVTKLRGWWHNRVARTLLVFVFSTMGSAIGTYVAGFRIAEKLSGG